MDPVAGGSSVFKRSDLKEPSTATAARGLKPPAPQLGKAAGSSPGPLTGATVNGSMLVLLPPGTPGLPGEPVNYWDPAFYNGIYVPAGYGNFGVSPPDNIPVNDTVTEFGYFGDSFVVTADLQISGEITLAYLYQRNGIFPLGFTLRSAAFTRATNFTVLTNTFQTQGRSLAASLVGDTLSISVGSVTDSAPKNFTFTIQLEFPPEVSGSKFNCGPAQCGFVG